MEHIKKIIERMYGIKIDDLKQKGTKPMEQKETKKKSYVCYVYGQIYNGYLTSGKQTVFLIENLHVREWKNILAWLKKNNYIKDYALGDSIEDAAKLIIKGFNDKEKIYNKYLLGIEKNLKAA